MNQSADTISYSNKFGLTVHYEDADFETRMQQRKQRMLSVTEKLRRMKYSESLLQEQIVDFHQFLKPNPPKKLAEKVEQIPSIHSFSYKNLTNFYFCGIPKHGVSNWQKYWLKGVFKNRDIDENNWKTVLQKNSLEYKNLNAISKQYGGQMIYQYIPHVDKTQGNLNLIKRLMEIERKLMILVVRHPIDRLYSAWSDKFRRLGPNGNHFHAHFYNYYKLYAEKNFHTFEIHEDYRPKTHWTSFADFIRYLLHSNYPKLLTAVDKFLAGQTQKIEHPESIYAYNENDNDMHWQNFMWKCLPSNFNTKIDYIIKTETATQDSWPIFQKVFPEQAAKPEFYNYTQEEKFHYQQNNKYEKVKLDPFWTYLPKNYKVALNFIFKYQLEMFGYDYYQ